MAKISGVHNKDEVQVDGATVTGSVNTGILYFPNITFQTGTAFTVNNSATLGSSITINESGIYSFTVFGRANNATNWWIIRNQLTQNNPSVDTFGQVGINASDRGRGIPATVECFKGDVIRIQDDTLTSGFSSNFFRAKKVS